jgi:hypothetical protein
MSITPNCIAAILKRGHAAELKEATDVERKSLALPEPLSSPIGSIAIVAALLL